MTTYDLPTLEDYTSGRLKTLGWEVLAWGTEMLGQPDGEYKGQEWQYTPEQALFILRFYTVDDQGNFIYRRAVLERVKGWGKSPLVAAICCTEAFGPARFAGWDADGEPVGKPASSPLVQIAAISDSQADNTMVLVGEMLAEGEAAYEIRGLDIMLSKVTAPGQRKIEKVTASPRGREGNRATFVVMDEMLWTGTPVQTPSGWTTVGDLNVGDLVFDEHGQPTPVVKVTEVVNDRPCYKLTWPDGTFVVASEGHLWYTKVACSAAKPKVRTTGEMFRDGRKFMTPRPGCVQFPHRELPHNPYVVGLWLGDGASYTPMLTIGRKDEEALRKILADEGFPPLWESRNPGRALAYRFGYKKDWDLPYGDKHIPREYLESAEDQRIALLQGLMDSDGCIDTNGYAVFVNQNKRLAEGVLELVRSLGLTASLTSRLDRRYDNKRVYKVGFRPDRSDIVRLPRKKERIKEGSRQSDWVSFSIEPTITVPTKCIGIDTPTHLWQANGVVTHNTHLWVPAERGPELAAALRRNAAKMGARTIETTNAHRPGENSVAEMSYRAFLQMQAGGTYDKALLFDTREVHVDDIYDKDKAMPALLEAYGDAARQRGGWVDIERIFAEVCDPNVSESEARRFYFNEKTEGKSTWLVETEWKACRDSEIDLDIENDKFALGFKGAIRNGAAALVACRLTDNALFLIGLWEKPDGAPLDWEVPFAEVDTRLRRVMALNTCTKLVCDPENWQEIIGRIAADYPDKVEEFWLTKNRAKAVKAIEQFETAARSGRLKWRDENISRHVLSCHREETPQGDIIRKETPHSKRYISAAQASVLALEAAVLSVEEGQLNERTYYIYSF